MEDAPDKIIASLKFLHDSHYYYPNMSLLEDLA